MPPLRLAIVGVRHQHIFALLQEASKMKKEVEVVAICEENTKTRLAYQESGKIKITQINGINVEFTGEYSTLIVKQLDTPGVVAHITQCLSNQNVNIAFMRLFREDKGATAYTVVESDEPIPESILAEIRTNENVRELMLVQM